MYKKGYVSEQFYDNICFPIDTDLKGKKYPLTSKADYMVCSKVTYHPNSVQEKRDAIEQQILAKNRSGLLK